MLDVKQIGEKKKERKKEIRKDENCSKMKKRKFGREKCKLKIEEYSKNKNK